MSTNGKRSPDGTLLRETCWLCGQDVGINKNGGLRQHRLRIAAGPRGGIRLGPYCAVYFAGRAPLRPP